MLQRNGPESQDPPLELDNCSQCTTCGGGLDHFRRCFDCKRIMPRRVAVAFVPSPLKLYAIDKREGEADFTPAGHLTATSEMDADRTWRQNHPVPDEAELRITPMLDNQPIQWKRVPVVELPAENEAVELGDEGQAIEPDPFDVW